MIKLNRKLDDWINSFMEFTENSEPPEAFRFWTAVSVLASALQRKCFIQWGSSLIFYPNLYIVLVGPSGVRKGTAMDPGFDLIEDIGKIKVSAQATSLQALIRRIKETNYQDPDLNTGKMQFHSSMTIFSKEFTVFLGYHNKELMSSLCDWYDCDRKWAYETIARKKEEIVGVWVNLFGATTPSLIRSSLPLDAIGGGLTSRIIYIYEEKMGKMVLLPMETENEKKLRKLLLHDLDKITLLSGQFKYTKGFLGLWSEWRVDSDKNQMTLTTADLQRAIATLEKAELKMQGVFSGLGRSDTADILQRVITYLKLSKTDEIPMWQLARSFRNDMDKLLMDRIIATLEAMKFAKIIHKPQADDVIRILDRNI
jgi:hypothetical protein